MSRFAEFTRFFPFPVAGSLLAGIALFHSEDDQSAYVIHRYLHGVYTHTVKTLDGSEFKSNYPTFHFAGAFAQRNML